MLIILLYMLRPQSMTDVRMAISLSGDPVMHFGDVEYELYNLKYTDNKSEFELFKVVFLCKFRHFRQA